MIAMICRFTVCPQARTQLTAPTLSRGIRQMGDAAPRIAFTPDATSLSVFPMARDDELTFSQHDPFYLEAHLAVFDPRLALLGQVAFVIVQGVIWALYRPIASADHLFVWSLITGTVIAVIAAFDLAFILRNPSPDELMRVWRKLDKRLPMALDVAAVATLFLLLPHATDGLRALTVAYFVGYVPLQMISDPENARGNQTSIIVVLGSFALSLIWQAGPSDHALAALVIVYGAVLFISSSALRNGVITAQTEKFASDRAVQALHAERDAKTRFIAAATHDLGQPLMAARLFHEQALQAPVGPARDAAESGAARAFAAADALLSQMLQAMRLQADAVVPHPVVVTAGDVLANLNAHYGPAAHAAGAALRVVPSSVTLHVDPSLLDRALANLVQNAIAHAGARRILVGVRRKPNGRIAFWVMDDGRGIPDADIAFIFDEYFRGSGHAPTPGFGLGLASVQRLARLLGGTARCATRNRGAAFVLDLPRGKTG
jgi:signal transduction histidine kinase